MRLLTRLACIGLLLAALPLGCTQPAGDVPMAATILSMHVVQTTGDPVVKLDAHFYRRNPNYYNTNLSLNPGQGFTVNGIAFGSNDRVTFTWAVQPADPTQPLHIGWHDTNLKASTTMDVPLLAPAEQLQVKGKSPHLIVTWKSKAPAESATVEIVEIGPVIKPYKKPDGDQDLRGGVKGDDSGRCEVVLDGPIRTAEMEVRLTRFAGSSPSPLGLNGSVDVSQFTVLRCPAPRAASKN